MGVLVMHNCLPTSVSTQPQKQQNMQTKKEFRSLTVLALKGAFFLPPKKCQEANYSAFCHYYSLIIEIHFCLMLVNPAPGSKKP